jgi:probable rRNA maturation factor
LDWQTQPTAPPGRPWLAIALRRIAALAGLTRGRLGVAVVDAAAMADLHQRYSGVPGPTDVLTFDLRDDPAADAASAIDGDVVLCLDVADRQARRRGHDTRLELLLYAVHGLLHLQGYDDHTAADARAMHRREDELLTAAGFGAVFGRGTTRARR